MSTVLTILIVLAALAALAMLIRGVVIFLRTTEAELHGKGPSLSSQRQNKAMMARVGFQALAILLVALLLLFGRG